jgi:hypothetical protein
LSNFTAFELFFDDMHLFLVFNRFAFDALGVACDDVSAKINDCGVPLWGFFDSRLNHFCTSFMDGLPGKQLFKGLILVNRFDCTTCGGLPMGSTLMLSLSERAILK